MLTSGSPEPDLRLDVLGEGRLGDTPLPLAVEFPELNKRLKLKNKISYLT